MSTKPAKTLLTTAEIAKQHGVTRAGVHVKMKAQGVEPADQVGQIYRWRVSDVEAALKRSPFEQGTRKGQRKKKAHASGSEKRAPRRP